MQGALVNRDFSKPRAHARFLGVWRFDFSFVAISVLVPFQLVWANRRWG
jgi:hypothetical protein